ncbi:MAG: hypothetical protein DRJ09_09815 [Bacteroidetes bacterium]|nr:MAG: hypothetical protein DRJ09_09815 [Bacteroidota bacterium]
MTNNSSINLNKLRSYVGENETDVEDMIKLFLQIIPEQKKKLQTALEKHDWENLNYTAHQIKPSLDILGLEEAKEKARVIENLAKTGIEVKVMEQFVTELCLSLDKICSELTTTFEHFNHSGNQS